MATPHFLKSPPFCLTHTFLAKIFRSPPLPISINFEKVELSPIYEEGFELFMVKGMLDPRFENDWFLYDGDTGC